MEIIIKNSDSDVQGNSAENIFLAFDEENNYMGYGFVYPELHFELTPDQPYNLYLDINVAIDKPCFEEVRKRLFDAIMERARELRKQHSEISARVYGGCLPGQEDKLKFYVSQGFIRDDGSYIYEVDINNSITDDFRLGDLKPEERKFETKEEKDAFLQIYNSIFAKKLDSDSINELSSKSLWTNFSIYSKGEMAANIMVYAVENESDERVGFIENIFVAKEFRGRGIARVLMNRAFKYFQDNGIRKSQLEVWARNKYAVKLYESLGYRAVKESEIYPGVNL